MIEKKPGNIIGSPRKVKGTRVIEGLEFRGSMARSTLIDNYYDRLKVIDVDIPAYELLVDDKPVPDNFSMKGSYDQGKYPKDLYTGHYANYYHGDYAKLQYRFENSTGRNLLFIADSNSNCMEPYLASHFDNTYVIDVRY
jgi:hypothetical protein